jgi:hypothetical protein
MDAHTIGNQFLFYFILKKILTDPNLKGFQSTKKPHFLYPLSSLAYTNTTSQKKRKKKKKLELKQVKTDKTPSSQSKAAKH